MLYVISFALTALLALPLALPDYVPRTVRFSAYTDGKELKTLLQCTCFVLFALFALPFRSP